MATTTRTPGHDFPLAGVPPRRAPLLVATGLTKRFGQIEALTNVDFEIRPGEVVALVGDNGAGKSTLIKTLSGVQPADSGTIAIDGERVSIRTASDAYRHGIATVYQDLALCDNLDVVANLFLGGEQLNSPLTRSRLGQPRLVILDEPTAALGVVQTAQVLELVRRLRDQGLAVIVISHNLDNVYSVADRIVVLRLGRVAASFDRRSTPREDVVAAITGAAHTTAS